MVFNATFNNISAISWRFNNSFIGGGNRRKPPTCQIYITRVTFNSLFWFNCMYGIYKYYYIDIKVRSIGDFLRVLRFPLPIKLTSRKKLKYNHIHFKLTSCGHYPNVVNTIYRLNPNVSLFDFQKIESESR
jgi:hypothetical protein